MVPLHPVDEAHPGHRCIMASYCQCMHLNTGSVQAMKHAFAMRSNLGDPGVCGANAVPGVGSCIQDMQPILTDMVSPIYAENLRCDLPVKSLHIICPAMMSAPALTDRRLCVKSTCMQR